MNKMTIPRIPFIHLARSTATRMWLVSSCAGLAVLQSSWGDSFASLSVAAAAVVFAVAAELVVNAGSGKHTIRDGSTVASALVYVLLLPNQIHPVIAALGALFGVFIIKHSFGGLGANWLNPAVGGWLFVRFSWPDAFARALAGSPLDGVGQAVAKGLTDPSGSPLALLKISAYKAGASDGVLTAALNNSLFSRLGAELPGGYIDLFSISGPGIIADRGIFALLLGTLVLTAFRSSRAWIPAVYLGVLLALVRGFGALPFGGSVGNGDMLFALLTGGTLAAAFLLSADPATGPKSDPGTLAAVVASALLAFVCRFFGLDAYGAFIAVGLVNALTPLIRSVETRLLYRHGSRP
jgi:electron transport complex protein RnfD